MFLQEDEGLYVCLCTSVFVLNVQQGHRHLFSHAEAGLPPAQLSQQKKKIERYNPIPKWPRHGAADNHIICRFNWKYESQCTPLQAALMYTLPIDA